MSQVAFDTLAYANKLKCVGIDSKIAEAHAQIQSEVLGEWMDTHFATKQDFLNLPTKQDLANFATKQDLLNFATKQDLANFATKQDLLNFVTKQDLVNFATKQDLLNFATKQDLANFATKQDLSNCATKQELRDLREEMHAGFANVVTKVEFRAEMKILEHRMIIRMGIMMTSLLTLFFGVFKILHF